MSTRGIIGIRINGEDKLAYNHSDSYPSELGHKVVEFCRALTSQRMWDEVKFLACGLKATTTKEATPAEVKKFARYAEMDVSSGDPCEWYVLLRGTQGSLAKMLDAGVYENANAFINDSLFCEYAYILNLDSMTLELYEGYQKQPHSNGRYASNPLSDGYYPCALVGEFPLKDIPDNWAACFKAEA